MDRWPLGQPLLLRPDPAAPGKHLVSRLVRLLLLLEVLPLDGAVPALTCLSFAPK